MTGGIPELLCRSPSSGVDLNQDFSRLRFRYGTCYRLKVQLVCKLHCFRAADAVAVGRALIAALLFVGKRSASFSDAKFADSVCRSVLRRRRTHWIFL